MSDKTAKQQRAEDAMFVVLDWEEDQADSPRFVTQVVGADSSDDCPVKIIGVYASAEEAEKVRRELESGAPKRAKGKDEDKGEDEVEVTVVDEEGEDGKGKAKGKSRKGGKGKTHR